MNDPLATYLHDHLDMPKDKLEGMDRLAPFSDGSSSDALLSY
jgi:hypothetical protein